MSRQIALAHTGEHIFMGSLQKIIPNITVKKVEQAEDRNSLYVRSDDITWDHVLQAEKVANSIINAGRNVIEHNFPNLEEARKKFPKMRAIEDRISGAVRVVEVEGYDYAACVREHAKNSRECVFFLVTSFSREGQIYEIRFEVGEKAKAIALEYSALLMKVSSILGASINTIEKTASNLKEEAEVLRKRIREFSEKEVSSISKENIKDVKIYEKVFEGLENKILMDKAGEIIRDKMSVVIFANRAEKAFILLARSPTLRFNSAELLRNALALFGGKGGGKDDFASGSVENSKLEQVIAKLKEMAISAL